MTNSLAAACAPITKGYYGNRVFLPIGRNEEWFPEISWDGVTLRFDDPIGVWIRKEGNYFFIEVPDLNIYIAEESRAQAVDSFKEEMIVIWQKYVEQDPDQLQVGALRIRDEMLKKAKRV